MSRESLETLIAVVVTLLLLVPMSFIEPIGVRWTVVALLCVAFVATLVKLKQRRGGSE